MTGLYKSLLTNQVDDEHRAIIESEWSATPYIVDVFVEGRESQILQWCRLMFGQQSEPMRNKIGVWRCGLVNFAGWKYFGFQTREMMEEFEKFFPNMEEMVKNN